jgi:hypothetical protein
MSNLVSKEEYKKRLIEIIESAIKQDRKVVRFKNLLSDNTNFGDNYHTNPKTMSFEISSTGETAYQRAILKSGTTLLDFKEGNGFESVQWIDGELPIVFNKNPRRPSIDLIGLIDNIPALCELKFAQSRNSDSPLYAAIELLTYYCFIQFNADILDKYNVSHKNLKPYRWNSIIENGFPRLIVCANKTYWNVWAKKYNMAQLRNQVFDWGTELDTNINLFQTQDFDFKNQKHEGKYTPFIPTNSIWEIIKA